MTRLRTHRPAWFFGAAVVLLIDDTQMKEGQWAALLRRPAEDTTASAELRERAERVAQDRFVVESVFWGRSSPLLALSTA